MRLLEFCRNKSFWFLDRLKGSAVKEALTILEKCENSEWNDEEVFSYQKKQLIKLLKHCQNTVPIYGKIDSLKLCDWPILKKNDYREDYSKYLSIAYQKEKLFPMSTSGSTGTPFVCYQDLGKRRHVYAEVLYYNGKVNYQIGKRIIYLRSIVGECNKSVIQQIFQNIYLLDCQDLSDDGIEKKLNFIRKYTKKCDAMLMGYSSTLDAFRRYFDKFGHEKAQECNISGIVGGSEMLFDNTRMSLEQAFHCKCVSRYANEENGFLGQDYTKNNIFIPNRANYYIEILKLDSDESAELNEVGRIVVTDLYNYAMPMIRYDTGDVGAWTIVKEHGVTRKAIGSFGGRIVDMIFDSEGKALSPHSITNLMWRYQNIKQFQFAQIACKTYEMRLVIENGSINEKKMIDELHVIVGKDAFLSIKYLSTISTAKSGKKKYILNEMFS